MSVLRLRSKQRERYGWEQRPNRSLKDHVRRGLIAAGILAVTTLFTGFIGTLIVPGLAYRAFSAAANLFRPDPTYGELIVSQYVEQTRTASFWQAPPAIFENSTDYMAQNIAAFDPSRVHRYRAAPVKVFIPPLVRTAPLFTGGPVEVLGLVSSFNLLGRPFVSGRAEWVIQLRPISVEGALVYCRVTRKIVWEPPESIIRARGLVIAAGNVSLSRGGSAPAVYMACSAVAPAPPEYRRLADAIAEDPKFLPRFRKWVAGVPRSRLRSLMASPERGAGG